MLAELAAMVTKHLQALIYMLTFTSCLVDNVICHICPAYASVGYNASDFRGATTADFMQLQPLPSHYVRTYTYTAFTISTI